MSEWYTSFFDEDYLTIAGHLLNEETSAKQAHDLWSMLDLTPGCRVLDAPCGYGRLSRPLATLGAIVLGIDQSETLLQAAERQRGDVPHDRLRYRHHDLRAPVPESDFDVACNIFTSFGYGTEEEDMAIFMNLRAAVRPGGRVLFETNHRDMMCAFIARGSKLSMRLPDGTIFMDEPGFDAVSGIVTVNWYWSGPKGYGEKHAQWRCYTPTQIVTMIERAGLRFAGAFKGLTTIPFRSEGSDAGGRLSVIGIRDN